MTVYNQDSWIAKRADLKAELAGLAFRLYRHEQPEGPRADDQTLIRGRYIQSYLSACDGNTLRLETFLSDAYNPSMDEIGSAIDGIQDCAMHTVIAGGDLTKVMRVAGDSQLLEKATNLSLGALSRGLCQAFDTLGGGQVILPAQAEKILSTGDFLRQQYPYIHGVLGQTWIGAALGSTLKQVDKVAAVLTSWPDNDRKARCATLVTKLQRIGDSVRPA